MVIHYKEALYQVYGPLPLLLLVYGLISVIRSPMVDHTVDYSNPFTSVVHYSQYFF